LAIYSGPIDIAVIAPDAPALRAALIISQVLGLAYYRNSMPGQLVGVRLASDASC